MTGVFAHACLCFGTPVPQVAAEALSFTVALLLDYAATGSWTGNEAARAEQLRGVIERLGPAYVKVAQVRPASAAGHALLA